MTFKLFTEIYDTIKKVFKDINAITDIPKSEREKYRDVVGDTFALMDTTINMINARLGDILSDKYNPDEKLREILYLERWGEWEKAERNFRLCSNLRANLREMTTLKERLKGKILFKNWEELTAQLEFILATEGELAEFVGRRFNLLSNKAATTQPGTEGYFNLIKEVRQIRSHLVDERRQLIKQEIDIYNIAL